MSSDYLTLNEPFETELEIKKSRFIGRVYPVKSEAEADAIIAANKKEHYKATHVCSAWVLNTTPERQKASDDGEPSGTAGKPMLEVLKMRELKDVLVVVIRYFGGIKLGAGGLIRAYSGSAAAALDAAQIVKKQLSDILSVTIDYTSYGGLMNVLSAAGYKTAREDFGEKVTLEFEIEMAKTEAFVDLIRETTNGRFEYEILDQKFVDIFL
ncbi:MAG: YigZ family protein [Eubacterium sp.]|nr:YigZ family protein [Eubacterium sp.]